MPTLSCSMWDLLIVSCPGIEPKAPALGAWSLSHWTTREVLMLKYQNTKAPIHQASVYFLSFPSRLSRGLFTQAKLASSLSLGLGHSSWPWALAFFCSPNWNSLYSSLHNQSQLKGQAQMVPPLRICLRLPWWLRR